MERSFGLILILVLILIGFYPYDFYIEQINFYIISLAIVILFITLFKKDLLYIPTRLWIILGLKLGKFLSPIFILLIYLIGFIMPSFILKLLKIDIIDKEIYKHKNSYWYSKNSEKINMKDQF